MILQSSFSALEFAARKKLTRRERFLREVDTATPWAELAATVGNALLQGEETDVFADAGCQGADKRDGATGVKWHVAMRPSGRRRWKRQPRIGKLLDNVKQVKAAVTAKIEHTFNIVKNRFGLKKVRYRGLAKNMAQLFALFRLAYLLIAKRQPFDFQAQDAS